MPSARGCGSDQRGSGKSHHPVGADEPRQPVARPPTQRANRSSSTSSDSVQPRMSVCSHINPFQLPAPERRKVADGRRRSKRLSPMTLGPPFVKTNRGGILWIGHQGSLGKGPGAAGTGACCGPHAYRENRPQPIRNSPNANRKTRTITDRCQGCMNSPHAHPGPT